MDLRWSLLAISVTAHVSCFSPTIAEGLSCGPDELCPNGQFCGVDGICRTEGDIDDGADADVDCPGEDLCCREPENPECIDMPPGGIRFGAPIDIPIGQNPSAIVSGDVTGDGVIDLLVAQRADDEPRGLIVFAGDGAGSFAVVDEYLIGNFARGLIIADFDQNGLQDFAWLAEESGSQQLVVVKQIAAGTWDTPTTQIVPPAEDPGVGWRYLHYADFNGDLRNDLVFQGNGDMVQSSGPDGTYAYLPQHPDIDGQYEAAQEFQAVRAGGKSHLADLNRDGLLDVISIGDNGIRYSQQSAQAPGTFGPGFLLLARMGQQIIGKDLNDDGALDITAFADNSVWTILQDSDNAGAFLSPIEEVGGSGLDRIAATDLNDDGRTDVFFSAGYSMLADPVAYGSFSNGPTVNVVNQQHMDLAADDFNGDGKPDLAILHRGDSQFATNGFVRVYLQL